MKPILDRIKDAKCLVADGAMGTMLFNKGLKPGACPETVNLDQPGLLEEIAGDYMEAGAEIIQTNTFGASPMKLAMYDLEDKCDEINRTAVLRVKGVAGNHVYISGSCGPTGKLLKPYGDTESDEMFLAFKCQMKALISAGVDLICIETMTDLQEAILAVKAARSIASQIPVAATMTFDETPRGFYTIMGVSVQDAAVTLQNAGADIIGSNCGNGIENMIKIATEFRDVTSLPLIIQSNTGIPETIGGALVYNEDPDYFAEKAEELIQIGVAIIGGCCGTTPEHIRALRRMVDNSF